MKRIVLGLAAALLAAPAVAQEPAGCDKFKWPVDSERALLARPDIATVASGAQAGYGTAVAVSLAPLAQANLPKPPERMPKAPDTFAGYVRLPAPPSAGTYRISLSAEGWIDVVQNDAGVKSGAFSGATGCDGIRKSVTFPLAAAPLTVELSAVRSDTVRLVVTPHR